MLTSERSSDRRAVVVGSGFGGLAAAIRLQAAGVRTTLLERLDKPGGRAYVYHDDGFVFDAGPTVITAPDALEELFKIAGRNMADYVELMPVRPLYRLLWEDGTTFDYEADEHRLLANIHAISPGDVDGYMRFHEYAQEVFEAGYVGLSHVPFLRFWDMVKVGPKLARLGAHRSVYDTVARYFKHEKLRQAFSFNSLLIGGNPFSISSIYTLIHPLERRWGVYFPRGGTHALVRALVRLFEDLGGKLRTSCGAARILLEEADGRKVVHGVRDEHGGLHACDLVVSNADVVSTYATLLGDDDHARRRATALKAKRHSMSLFVVYFGTRKRYPGLVHHNVLFGARYRELLDDIFEKGVLADDFSVYLHAPTETDPSLAPEGCHSFYALAPVPNLEKASIDWSEMGPRYAKRIIDYLGRRYMPGLAQDIVTMRTFSPIDFEQRLGAHAGAAFSLEPTLLQSAYFRVHNRDDRIRGLYFVGAGTHPGAGVPGVIGSAKATYAVIAEDLRLPAPAPATFDARWIAAPC